MGLVGRESQLTPESDNVTETKNYKKFSANNVTKSEGNKSESSMDFDDKVMKMDSGSTKHEMMVPVNALERHMLKYCNIGNGGNDVGD